MINEYTSSMTDRIYNKIQREGARVVFQRPNGRIYSHLKVSRDGQNIMKLHPDWMIGVYDERVKHHQIAEDIHDAVQQTTE